MWEFLHILTNPCLFSLIFFFIIAILMSVEWYLTAVFIFIYLMIDGIEYNHFYWILDIVMIALLSVWFCCLPLIRIGFYSGKQLL